MGESAGAGIGVAQNVLGGVGSVVSGIIAKDTANKVGKQQSRAIDKIRAYTQEQMDPALVNKQAAEADIQRAKARLELQAQIDPALAAQRTAAESKLSEQLAGIGTSDSDRIAALAAAEGAKGVPGMDEAKKGLIDAALTNLRLGGSLPPDVQAELVQAGLQQSGQVTGAAGGAAGGVGSSILNQVLGTAGLKLRAERETQAANLAGAASNLEAQRQQILQGLFPRLQEQQLSNMKATSGILQQSDAMLPQVGLSGSDVANIWLSRVGAMNQLAGQKANVQANAKMAVGQGTANIWGSVASAGQWKPQTGAGAGAQDNSGGGGGLGGISSFFNSSGGGSSNNQPVSWVGQAAVPSY